MVTPLTPDDPVRLGEFRLSGRLGQGGQGVVYLAHGPSGKAVALKLLSHNDPETRARLARELAALESVASFCTARVLTASTGSARPYVVSEFVDGPSLFDRVRERGPLRGGDLERLVVGTATALAAIHAAGVVHRDFKPSNVLLGPDGPRVVDFGIARAEGTSTMTSGLIGTPAYLAPEQIGGSPAGAATDVFAWAGTMLFAATGVTPFGADTVPAVLHRVLHNDPDLSALPPRLQALIGSCLSKDPSRRPTARALMMSLVDPQARPDLSPRPAASPVPFSGYGGHTDPGPAPQTTRPPVARRSSRGALVGALIAVVAVVGTGTALWLNRPADTSGITSTLSPAVDEPTPDYTDSPETTGGDLEIPKAFAGKWSGHTTSTNPYDQNGADNTVDLRAGASSAPWTETDGDRGCERDIPLEKVGKDTLTFRLEEAGECVAGTIWLTLKGEVLTYTWKDGPGFVTQTGALRRR